MPQTLYLQDRDIKTGKSAQREVRVIRSWSEADGRQVYLHTSGVYGYKSGEPVVAKKELDIIVDPTQRKLAYMWWDRIGQAMSQTYYAERQAEIEKGNLAGTPMASESSDLDSVLYIRRPVKNRARSAFSDPYTWFEWFDKRPDWWGHAAVIEMGEWRYELLDAESSDADDPEKGAGQQPSQTGGGNLTASGAAA